MSDAVLYETDGHIGLITINRPDKLNALNEATLEALGRRLDEIAAQNYVRAVVVTGAGDKAFAAGADLVAMKEMTPDQARRWSLLGQRVFCQLEDLPQPVVAAINGYALGGGCELALACDIRLASESAVLGQPEVTLGIPPGFGASYRLSLVVGAALARDMILTGRRLEAAEAEKAGLVSAVVSGEGLMETATRWARNLAAQGPAALEGAKELIRRATLPDRERLIEMEADVFARSFETGQPLEGMSAFLEKRKAQFS